MQFKLKTYKCDQIGIGLDISYWPKMIFEIWPQFNIELHLWNRLYTLELHFKG